MLELNNKTPLSVELIPGLDKYGYEHVTVILKAKFKIVPGSAKLVFSDEPVTIHKSDEYYGEPGESSIRYGSDVCLRKLSTDIVLNGHAYAPNGKPCYMLDASIEYVSQSQICRVFGDRYWQKNGLSWEYTQPQPFEKMPLKYEYAYGGFKLDTSGENIIGFSKANPVGKGYIIEGDKGPESGLPLPNIEDPRTLIQQWQDRPMPSGFASVAPDWQPRASLAGTYDNSWQESRMPLLPLDFDERFYNCAHSSMVASSALVGGENFTLKNLSESGFLSFKLPVWDLPISVLIKGKQSTYAPSLNTVVIEPDEDSVYMTWGSSIPCYQQLLYVDEITIGRKRAA